MSSIYRLEFVNERLGLYLFFINYVVSFLPLVFFYKFSFGNHFNKTNHNIVNL